MSDTTETVSLRDALTELLRERRHDFNITYEEDADAVLDLLRAHCTEALKALGGVYHEPFDAWVFREASE